MQPGINLADLISRARRHSVQVVLRVEHGLRRLSHAAGGLATGNERPCA